MWARPRPRPRPRRPGGSRGQQQGRGDCQEEQRVVVGAAHGEHEHHGVQPYERGGPPRRLAESSGCPRDQRHRAEARRDGDRLERPQPAREPQRRDRVADEREQRAVGGVLKRPADEAEHWVGRRFGGHMCVRVQSVQRPQPRERQIAEHVLGDQRWPQQQDHIRHHDRPRQRRDRQLPRGNQYEHVARAHDQHQRLEGAAAQAEVEPVQRSRQPRRPAAAAGGDVLRGRGCGAGADHEDRCEDPQQPNRAEGLHRARGGVCARPRTCALRVPAGDPHGWCGGCGRYAAHCCVSAIGGRPALPIT
jgi:hypothetical protein